MSTQIQTNSEAAVYRFQISKKATAAKSYFSTVTSLVILLKQDGNTGVFGKASQIFRADIFYVTSLDGYF